MCSKSIENWPQSSRGGTSTSYLGSQISISTKACRGSDVKVLDHEISPSTSKSGSEKRTRFGLFLNWRPTKFQSSNTNNNSSLSSSSPQSPVARTTFGIVSGGNPKSRRSEEALRFLRYTQSSEDDDGGRLTAARRASSWGQGDKELHEVVSVTSIERELNDHDMNVGAGGVSRDGDDDFGIGIAASGGGGSSSFPLFDSILGNPNGYRNHPPAAAMVQDSTFDDVNERYGQPFYDEDSSTLASGPPGDDDNDDWQRGSEFDDNDADEDEDDDEDDDDENGVTFSPRRRPLNLDE
jgi:[calcium/calmodulin-dependent protein kinase] kinase